MADHAERVQLEELGDGFYRVQAHYGFMEMPDVRHALQEVGRQGLTTDPASTSFILGREILLTSGRSKMMPWRKRLFRFPSQNATPATAYFGLHLRKRQPGFGEPRALAAVCSLPVSRRSRGDVRRGMGPREDPRRWRGA